MRVLITLYVFALSISLVFADDSVEQNVKAGLARLAPDLEVQSINKTPIAGVYQVIVGPDVIYMTGDGNYVLKGDLLDINQRRNLTEDVRADSRVSLLESIDKNDYIEFKGEEVEHTVYVFTDIDCGYCRRLHQDVEELNELGVSVRYLAYPRAGIGSNAALQMEYVWCAEDRQQAMTKAKNNERIAAVECNNPVAAQYELGRQIGVRGTPAIYSQNGKAIPGYMPPDRLIQEITR